MPLVFTSSIIEKKKENEEPPTGGSTLNSFFDDITTAKDVGEGRITAREEKALNLDTFGVSASLYSGRGRGGYYRRSGGRGRGRGRGHQNGRGGGGYQHKHNPHYSRARDDSRPVKV